MSDNTKTLPPCQHADQLELMASDVKEIKEALIGDFDKPGLTERVRTVEKEQEKQKWFHKTVLVTLLGVVGKVFGLDMIQGG